MPFRLRNAGATFQRLVNKMFKEQIRDTMEVYIDDMVVKSKNAADHVKDLDQVFNELRAYNMKLKPSKCNFAVSLGKFLGHMVTRRGIEVEPWSLYTDGASNDNGTGVGLVLKSPQGDTLAYSICYEFKATNNESEYEALIIGMTTALDLNIIHPEVNCDSLLIVNHVRGTCEAKDCKMMAYLEIVKKLQSKFGSFTIRQVLREQNIQADALVSVGEVSRQMNISNIPIIHILKPAMERNEEKHSVMDIEEGEHHSWTINGLLQRCLEKGEYGQVLRDVHDGDCGNHTGGRNLSCKILKMGYYWPTVKQDPIEYVKRCDACQRHAPIIHQPSELLHSSIPSWPFMKWGMDIVGKMPPAPG
ncbi:uncharacterized protein LOC141691074 [Apium graveolens]|uniref:uncharacterized protein LOC141691074 n=1 Tax=Apium graveolens TaxID=4045 RepID=UPI003D798B49